MNKLMRQLYWKKKKEAVWMPSETYVGLNIQASIFIF